MPQTGLCRNFWRAGSLDDLGMRGARALIPIVVVCSWLVAAGLASGQRRSHSHVLRLTPQFSRIGAYDVIQTNGRYVLLSKSVVFGGGPSDPAVLIDTKSGQRVTVGDNSGLTPSGLVNGPWLSALQSTPSATGMQTLNLHLYRLTTAPAAVAPITWPPCSFVPSAPDSGCVVGPVGAIWTAISSSCYHCSTTTVLENLNTGQILNPPQLPTNRVQDLNAPSASRKLCWPLRNTPASTLSVDINGSFDISGAPMGRSAIASSPTSNIERFERCGSRKTVVLPSAVITANSHLLVLTDPSDPVPENDSPFVRGLLVPSLRPFKLSIPRRLTTPTQNDPSGFVTIVLSSDRIYVASTQGEAWSAPLPPLASKP